MSLGGEEGWYAHALRVLGRWKLCQGGASLGVG